jgi:hypothetical protein
MFSYLVVHSMLFTNKSLVTASLVAGKTALCVEHSIFRRRLGLLHLLHLLNSFVRFCGVSLKDHRVAFVAGFCSWMVLMAFVMRFEVLFVHCHVTANIAGKNDLDKNKIYQKKRNVRFCTERFYLIFQFWPRIVLTTEIIAKLYL